MVDGGYLATLLDILTNPAPTGIDPADPYGQADDGIDRYNGFGRDVTVTGLRVVDGPHGDELEVTFALALPPGDPDWEGVPNLGATRVPFDEQWRQLSGLSNPAAYAPEVASKVESAARDHAARHQHGGRLARARAAWRARARAALPERETQRQLLLEVLAGEGEVNQVAPGRFELRLRHDHADDPASNAAGHRAEDPSEGLEDGAVLDALPEVITFVLSPEEWEEVLVDQYEDDLELYVAETLAIPDPEEQFVVFYKGDLHRSTRTQLPPVRGTGRERAWARLRAEHPPAPGDGWYSVDPNHPDRREDPNRRLPPQ